MAFNMYRSLALLLLATSCQPAIAHTVITYPGWRGDNFNTTNGTLPNRNPDALAVTYENGSPTFPWGMEWVYPCGGLPQSTNRTKWPVTGGAVAFQPGWFPGHAAALLYINVGVQGPGDLAPPNMSHNVVPPFQILGPSNELYEGSVCLPQVPLPANITFNIGDNITIQVVEAAQHGAALYNCVDVTLADPADVAAVNSSNCFNSSDIVFQQMFTTASLSSGSQPSVALPSIAVTLLCFIATMLTYRS